jgi:hypothetical protein
MIYHYVRKIAWIYNYKQGALGLIIGFILSKNLVVQQLLYKMASACVQTSVHISGC